MATLEEAKQSVKRGKDILQSQRQQVQERREQAQKSKEQIIKEKEKLPKKSQSRLRGGLYSGLEGRKRRRIISQAKERLESGEKDVQRVEKGLTQFEKEQLKPFESQIKSQEAEIQEIEKQEKAYKRAREYFIEGKGKVALSSLGKKYYDQIALDTGAAGAAERIKKQVSEKSEYTPVLKPGKPLEFDTSKIETPSVGQFIKDIFTNPIGKITGVIRPIEPGIEVTEISPKILPPTTTTPPTIKKHSIPEFSSLGLGRDLSRTDRIKDINPLSSMDIGKIESDVSLLKGNLRTTGSPIRYTKIRSLKSRGYIPDKKPRDLKKKLPRPKKQPESIKPKKKDYEDIFFTNKKLKKKGRKKSIWGF